MGAAHLQAARSLGCEPVAICDVRPESVQKARDSCGVEHVAGYSDPAEMFAAHPRANLVLIATTADSHRTLVEQAAASGAKAILCEKPMATSVADCEAMIEACQRSGSALAVNHQMRFMDQYKIVREELDSGRLGRLASMTVVAGCFGLAMNGSHYCEAFRWLSNSETVEASAWFSQERLSNPRGPQFSDHAGEVRFVSADRRRLILNVGADQGHGMTVTYAAQFGHMFVDELEGVYYATTRKAEHREKPATRYGMPWERREGRFPQADNVGPTRAVIASLIEGKGYPSGQDGLNAVCALVAAIRSADEGGRTVSTADLGDYRERHFPWA